MGRKVIRKAAVWEDRLWPAVVLSVALFMAMLYINLADAPWVIGAVVCLLAAGLVARLRGWKPGEQVTLPAVLFFGFTVMCGIASLYSKFAEQAAGNFARWLIAFLVFALASILCRRGGVRTLMLGVVLAITVVAVLGIDSASWKGITNFVLGTLLNMDTSVYTYWADGRVPGIFNNPNVTGSMYALGVLLSLYLARTARRQRERVLSYATLAISALAFLLSFSMGSIGFFVVAVVVYLAAAGKEERPGLLVLMVETALVTMLFGVLSTLGFGKTGALLLLPNLCMVAAAALLWLLDTGVGTRLSAVLAANRRAVTIGLAAVAAAGLIYVVAGFNLAGGMTLAPGETVRRSAYPAPGEYTLAGEGTGTADLQVTITTQNSQQTAMHTEVTVYTGAAQGARFTVPEDTRVAYFYLYSPGGGRVDAVEFSGPETGALKLNYWLIPEFAAIRIQGLWANQNVIQRGTFNVDALRIWLKSPVVGMGMGAYEGYHDQVADFSYITRYVHNVYTQTMAETGLVGLLLLLGTLGAFFLAALRGRRDGENAPMAAPLLACLAMVAGHGVFEVIWSSAPYMLLIPLLLAMVQVVFGPLAVPPVLRRGQVRTGVTAACAVLAVVFGYFYLQPTVHKLTVESAARNEGFGAFLSTVERCAKFGAYDGDVFKVTYLTNVTDGGDEASIAVADGIAAGMVECGLYPYGIQAAQYYFERGQTDAAFDALGRSALWAKALPDAWNMAVESMMMYADPGDPAYVEGVRAFRALWEETAAGQLDGLPLKPECEAYLRSF